jgi:hypothetical protein
MGPSNGKVRITFPYSVKSIDGKKVRLVGAEGFEPPALCSQSRLRSFLPFTLIYLELRSTQYLLGFWNVFLPHRLPSVVLVEKSWSPQFPPHFLLDTLPIDEYTYV